MVEYFIYTENVIGSSPIPPIIWILMFSFFNNNKQTNTNFLNSITNGRNVMNFLSFGLVSAEPSSNWQFGFQTPASPTAEGIMKFHDDLMFFLVFILFFVMYILAKCFEKFTSPHGTSERLIHASTLEVIWTIIPALILVVIAIPSFALLYSMDEMTDPYHTFKVIGHQWYWSYEWLTPTVIYNHLSKENVNMDNSEVNEIFNSWDLSTMDSYMLSKQDVFAMNEKKQKQVAYNNLSVDNNLYLPVEKTVRALVTSSDVLHSWAIPSLGVKVDACPGRLNQINFMINRVGFYFGQCSEICGLNHGFMPISIYGFYSPADFLKDKFQRNDIDIETILSCLDSWAQTVEA